MNKNKLFKKRILSILLVVTCLSTSSCKKKESMTSSGTVENEPVISESSKPMKLSSSDETVAPETNYFVSKTLDFVALEEGETAMVWDSVVTENRVFLIMNISNDKKMNEAYELAYEKRQAGKISEAEQIEDGLWEENNQRVLFILDMEGNLITRVETDSIVPEDNARLYPGSSEEVLLHLYNDFNENAVEDLEYLCRMDAEGKLIGERILVPAVEEEGKTRHYDDFAIDDKGNLYAKGYCSSQTDYYGVLDVFTPNGKHLFSLQDESDKMENYRFDNLYVSNQMIYLMTTKNWGEKQIFNRIDLEKQELIPESELSLSISQPDFRGGMFYFSDVEGIKSVQLESQVIETFLQWNDVDLPSTRFNRFPLVLSSDKVLMYIQRDWELSDPSDPEWFLLSRTTENPNAGKEIIRIGGYGISYYPDIGYAIRQYNEVSSTQRVELIDFSSWGINEESIDQIRMNLLAGDMPDILVRASENVFGYSDELDFNIMAQRNLLTDLSSFIDEDDAFHKDAYADIMFTLPKTDGKLFYTFTDYSLSGLLVKKEHLPERFGWTMQELREWKDSFPESQQVFSKISPESFLHVLVTSAMLDLVDFSNKEVFFNSGIFEEILRFSMDYGCTPEEANISIEGGVRIIHSQEREEDQIRNGNLTMSVIGGTGSPMGWRWLWNEAGSNVTLAGIPTKDTNRIICNPGKMIAIAENGKKEQAWEFIKILLSQKAQQKIAESFPVHQGQLQLLLEDQRKPPEEVGKSELLLYQPISDEAIQEFYNMQSRAAALSTVDAEIMEIIFSETQAYFANQKTLEATVDVVQNRVQTYVNQL